MEEKRISLVIPCYGRPARTRRMIDCISNQTINNFEAFIIGDGCPDFEKLLTDPFYQDFLAKMESLGNRIISFNMDRNYGGCGYHILNYALEKSTGKYFVFGANDDVIANDHLEFYLSGIENTDYDMVYYNSLVLPYEHPIRNSDLSLGHIGHSEIIVKTETAKKMPPHKPEYGHDWLFIKDLIDSGAKISKTANTEKTTYTVMSITGWNIRYRVDNEID